MRIYQFSKEIYNLYISSIIFQYIIIKKRMKLVLLSLLAVFATSKLTEASDCPPPQQVKCVDDVRAAY
jgi:hypothetical protein